MGTTWIQCFCVLKHNDKNYDSFCKEHKILGVEREHYEELSSTDLLLRFYFFCNDMEKCHLISMSLKKWPSLDLTDDFSKYILITKESVIRLQQNWKELRWLWGGATQAYTLHHQQWVIDTMNRWKNEFGMTNVRGFMPRRWARTGTKRVPNLTKWQMR